MKEGGVGGLNIESGVTVGRTKGSDVEGPEEEGPAEEDAGGS